MSKFPDSTQFLELMHALEDWKFYLNTDGVCCLDKVAEDKSKRKQQAVIRTMRRVWSRRMAYYDSLLEGGL